MIAPAEIIPTAGQKTTRQFSWSTGGACYSGGIAQAAFNPSAEVGGVNMIWPTWGSLLCGSDGTYRAMMRHPTINFVAFRRLLKVIASKWILDIDEDAPQEVKDWVTANVLNFRNQIIVHACRSAIFGRSPFEVVWNGSGKSWNVEKYVELLPDNTTVLRDDNGNGEFSGLKNGQAELSVANCLYILNSGNPLGAEPGNDYGVSDLENIRDTAWAGWLDTARRLAELEDRASGMVPLIIVPAGIASNGKSYAENASGLLVPLNAPRSYGAVIESPAIGEADASTDPGRFKQLSTTVSTLDMGDRAASQASMQAKLRYWDVMMARGLGQSERAVFQTDGGTKADSAEHMESAEPGDEALDNSITSQVNAQVVRTGILVNFGADMLAKVRGVKPVPLVDSDRAFAQKLYELWSTNTATGQDVLSITDVDKTAGTAGVSLVGKWKDLIADKAAKADAIANQPPAPPAEEQKSPAELKLSDEMVERLNTLWKPA